MGKGMFNMYKITGNGKTRKSLYSRSITQYPKHQSVEARANIAHSISSDLSKGVRACARDISSIVNLAMRKGN